MIMKLCLFFNAISQKVVDPMMLTKLQDALILTMCSLETIFPPSFFDLMPHLLVHIVHEMKYLGPNEDINTSATIIPSIEILGPIT
jgi:hypothetical protein